MNDLDLAQSLFRKPSEIVSEAFGGRLPAYTVEAEAMEDSIGGTVAIQFMGDTVNLTDGDPDGDGTASDELSETGTAAQWVSVPCSATVMAGERVLVTIQDGSPIDCTSVGWGDRVRSRTVTLEERTDEVVVNIESVMESADDLSDRVTAAEEGITENANAIEEEVNTRSAYIRFTSDESGNPLIELGAEDSDLMLRLTNEQIGFLNGDELVAYITGQLLNISNAKVSQTLQFGDFAWIPRSNRNLALKWIGGDV